MGWVSIIQNAGNQKYRFQNICMYVMGYLGVGDQVWLQNRFMLHIHIILMP
jgi:hypothetical protein